MIVNERGGFSFVPGTSFLSFGSIAQPGYAIERAVFRKPRSVETGFEEVRSYLKSIGRPLQALCGMEFHQFASTQWSGEDFGRFNAEHVRRLTEDDLLVEAQVPVARTNVVLKSGQPAEQGGLHAFSYTVALEKPSSVPNFVFAAIPEVRFSASGFEVIAEGETSSGAIERKLTFILDAATKRLEACGLSWDDVTGSQLYGEVDLHPFMKDKILASMGAGGWRGIQCHYALPPIGPAILELDFRSVKADLILS